MPRAQTISSTFFLSRDPPILRDEPDCRPLCPGISALRDNPIMQTRPLFSTCLVRDCLASDCLARDWTAPSRTCGYLDYSAATELRFEAAIAIFEQTAGASRPRPGKVTRPSCTVFSSVFELFLRRRLKQRPPFAPSPVNAPVFDRFARLLSRISRLALTVDVALGVFAKK
jgi:hypothetical protein